jgi:hypothetical protein
LLVAKNKKRRQINLLAEPVTVATQVPAFQFERHSKNK